MLVFTACSSTTSSDDDFDDEEESSSSVASSSSGSSSSSSDSTATSSSSATNKSLASPTSLSYSQISSTSWMLTWSYTQDEVAETGFIIQRLNIDESAWEEVGRSNSEVYHYLLSGEEYGGYYYRVCAYNDDGTSSWTSEVYITSVTTSEDEAVLASPSSLSSAQLSTTRWILTWGYTQEENAPESGFIIEQLDLATSEWVEVGRANAEVYHYLLSGENYAGYYYRVCAYNESDTSDYSSELYVEATTTSTAPGLASPTSLTNEDYVTDVSWVLTWEYTQNEDYPETGFIIQKLDWDEGDWVEIARTVTGVYHYLLNSPDYAGYYYRVCAYNDDGNSLWSEETFIGTIE